MHSGTGLTKGDLAVTSFGMMHPAQWEEGQTVTAGPYELGLFQPSPETHGFWEGIAACELRVKACNGCQLRHHPRRIVCYKCGCESLRWINSSGDGTIYSCSEIHRDFSSFAGRLPYTVGIIHLVEGVYYFSRLYQGGPQAGPVEVGARVKLTFVTLEWGGVMPVFETTSNNG
jgi:uncharacterized OB-fold protein